MEPRPDALPAIDVKEQPEAHDPARREFVKRAAYVPPAIVTLSVAPAYAKPGSEKKPPKRR
jgi:hypothetical protein